MSWQCPKQACLDTLLVREDLKYSSLSDGVSGYIWKEFLGLLLIWFFSSFRCRSLILKAKHAETFDSFWSTWNNIFLLQTLVLGEDVKKSRFSLYLPPTHSEPKRGLWIFLYAYSSLWFISFFFFTICKQRNGYLHIAYSWVGILLLFHRWQGNGQNLCQKYLQKPVSALCLQFAFSFKPFQVKQ